MADVGMMAAGWIPLWAIEHHPTIAACYRANIHACILVADVTTVDFAGLERPGHLHASPPCTRASVANSNAKESPLDDKLAQSVCRAIRTLRPDTFTLENVYGYRKFAAYHNICACLDAAGYWWEHHHCNAADYGVPQTRKRLILRATLADHLRPLPSPIPWVGWYAAIEDIIDTLPASKFADWQLLRLKDADFGDTFLQMTSNTQKTNPTGTGVLARPSHASTVTSADGARPRAFLTDSCVNTCRQATVLDGERRAFTVKAEAFRRPITEPKAFLCNESSTLEMRAAAEPAAAQVSSHRNGNQKAFIVEGTAAGTDNKFDLPVRQEDDPIFTVRGSNPVRAFLVEGDNQSRNGPFTRTSERPAQTIVSTDRTITRAWLDQGRVVSMTPRALARFQSVPDWYTLPPNKKLACTILGNGVACLMMQRIAESLTP